MLLLPIIPKCVFKLIYTYTGKQSTTSTLIIYDI